LSLFDGGQQIEPFDSFMGFWKELRSLELLSPHAMRRRARASDEVGVSGEKLSGFVARLSASDVEAMAADLRRFYPGVQGISTKAVKAGWKEIFVQEPHRQTSARHLNDGMLRVLAIISQLRSPAPCVILEEIENGISTEMLGDLTAYLAEAPQQVIFTTHSVLLLNYLRDEDAKASVFFLYKTPAGVTKGVRLFSIPRMQEKLTSMGPGEAFADTDLSHLVQELNEEPTPAMTSPGAEERPQ
jgi:predicted ATPase